MYDRSGFRSGFGRVAHGGAPYPTCPAGRGQSRRAPARLVVVALALLLLPCAPAWGGPKRLKASGSWRSYEVKAPGGRHTFRINTVAGCRYRLTAAHGTLGRPILEIGRVGEPPLDRIDSRENGKDAVHTWYAEQDALLEVHVRGFSASTGKGRVRLETLGPDGHAVKAHRRYLALTGERARVGDLLLNEPNRWELVVEVGEAYEITPTRGSAGRVRLRVLDWHGEVLADSTGSAMAWLAHPPVRFRVPPRAPAPDGEGAGQAPGPMRLEVRGLFDGGGTYGLRMRRLDPDQSVDPPAVAPPAPVERGPVAGESQAFRAGPGDLAVAYVPLSPNRTQMVQVRRGDAWVMMKDIGRGGTARSQEDALLAWFQPYYPGTYRFRGVPAAPPAEPQLMLFDRASLGGAPIHMGTGVDPTVRVRLSGSWTLVGLGVCMPGWDYIFVCVHAPDQGVAMRVQDQTGKTIASRSASARTISPGLGPSMRFRMRRPGVVRLEAKNARKRIVRPLLRRASN